MNTKHVLIALGLACLALLPSEARSQPQQSQITGSLSNFDVHQGCFPEADNFELDFLGTIDPDDFLGFYPGWGSPPRFDDIKIDGVDLGAEVLWLDRADPVPFCEWRHFGVRVDPDLPPTSVQAYWTKIQKVLQIPVPFQWWILTEFGVIDVLTFSETFDMGPVYIVREWAVSQVPIPLEELQYDSTPVPWLPGDEFEMLPGDRRELEIPMPPGAQAALVRYSVVLVQTGEVVTRFVTEVVRSDVDREALSVLVNFDLHNWIPGSAFDNLELDFFGDWLEPWMVRSWYANEDVPMPMSAWGVDPLIRRFHPGTFPGLSGGIEVTWLDKFDPFPFCETHHFGLEFDPAVQGGLAGGGKLYACDNASTLYQIDHLTGVAMPLCPLPLPATEIEFNNRSYRAVLQEADGGFRHQEFDIATCTPLAGPLFNGSAFSGLEFVGGVLYGCGMPGPCTPSDLYTIDVNTGLTTLIGPTGFGPISGMTFDPRNQVMYGVTGCWQQFGTSKLVSINLATGAGSLIGDTGVAALGGLAFGPDGNLYAIGANNEGGNFFRIDPLTGAAFLIGPTGFPGFSGLTLVGSGLPAVQAYWTSIDTCQVPVPWQFWRALPGGPIQDIVRLSETWPEGPISVDRQVTTVPFEIPLADLTWDGTEGLDWIPVPGDPFVLLPGDEVTVDIPVRPQDQAALVRYTVTNEVTGEMMTRFVNEAMIIPFVSDAPDVEPEMHGSGFESSMPNPFTDWTVLVYRLAVDTDVTLAIHDVTGRRLAVLEQGHREAGLHTVRWLPTQDDGKQLPGGVYFAVLHAAGETYQQKLVLRE